MTNPHRCPWASEDPIMRTYHDTECGLPQRDPRMLWEMLVLEGFQAGLAWITVLRKRDAFRKAFANFDPNQVAQFGATDVDRLMANAGIIRARAKIEATIQGHVSSGALRSAIEGTNPPNNSPLHCPLPANLHPVSLTHRPATP